MTGKTAEQNNTQLTGKIEFLGKTYSNMREFYDDFIEIQDSLKHSKKLELLRIFTADELLEELRLRGAI